MINRRLIRIKVLKIIYSHLQSQNTIKNSEKELLHSFQKVYDLYILLIILIIEIKKELHRIIEARKIKHLPSFEDLHPNMKFINNRIIYAFENNTHIMKYARENSWNWTNYDLYIRKTAKDIERKDFYISYLNNPNDNIQNDATIIKDIVNHICVYDEENPDEQVDNTEQDQNYTLESILEERSLYWIDDIDVAKTYILKTVDAIVDNPSNYKIPQLYKDKETDIQIATTLLRKTILNWEKWNVYIKEYLENWELDRIALMDNIIIKMAICEMLEIPSIPVEITMDEYIEISKAFSTPQSYNFINGIVDKIFKHLKQQNLIQKVII